ncbi:carboxypeptidase regulatory-like domain-containing protein, partial [Thermoproteota archaeon]
MSDKWVKSKFVFFSLVAIFLIINIGMVSGDIRGTIIDSDGAPIGQATVIIYNETREIATFQTGANGVFNVEVPLGQYTLIAFADSIETLGADYVPAALEVNNEFIDGEVVLISGSSLRLTGGIQFVNTEDLPLRVVYSVQDASGVVMSPSGFRLVFSDRVRGLIGLPGVSIGDIIVPSSRVVYLNVSSSFLIGSEVKEKGFLIEAISTANQGGIIEIDILEYTVPLSQFIANDALEELELRLTEMSGYGFYLAKQKAAFNSGIKHVEDAVNYYMNGDFRNSFDSLKRGYLLFTHTSSELTSMYREARLSVYVLIAFLTVASIITGYLLFDGFRTQVLA